MELSKIQRIVSTVVILFNMNTSQEARLNNYVRMYQNQWCIERKHEDEIEALIKEEAYRIVK